MGDSESDPVVSAVKGSLANMEETLRQQTSKMDSMAGDMHEIQSTLREMKVRDEQWVKKVEFVRLESDLRAAAKSEVLEVKLKLEKWTGIAIGLGLISTIIGTVNAIKAFGASP